jgi:hypothetical protein
MQHFLAPPPALENMDELQIPFVLWLAGEALPDLTAFATPIAMPARFDLGDVAPHNGAKASSWSSRRTKMGEQNA